MPAARTAAAVPGPTTATAGAGRPPASGTRGEGGEEAGGTVGGRQHHPVVVVEVVDGGGQRRPAVGRVDDGDGGHLDHRRALLPQAGDEGGRLLGGPGHDDGAPGEGARYPRKVGHRSSQHCVVSRSDSTSMRSSLPWKRLEKSS